MAVIANREQITVKDTAATLSAANRTYASNTVVIESDTDVIKVADGKTAYNDLLAWTAREEIVLDKSFKTTGGMTINSNTHIKGKPGVVVTCDDTINRSGFVADNATNIIIEGVTFDLKTTAYDGVTTPPKNDWPNFTTAIDFRNCTNIWIINCKFINTGSAHPDWTMQATNFQNVNGLYMFNNWSDACQYKLCGASASLQNVYFVGNYGKLNTQMGMSFVVQPATGVNEVASLQITAGATASDNVTVTLDGVATTVAVLSGDTAIGVADKIRAATFTGWTTGGTAGTDTVTFTATTEGDKTDATYSAGTTGATGTMTTTTQGSSVTLRLANINIVNNIFEDTDQHAIYGGVDNGQGNYPGTVEIENINIEGNQINRLAHLETSQTSKGILLNLTRTTRNVNVENNQIFGPEIVNTGVQGIQINTSPNDTTLAKGISVKNNKIYNTGNFNIFLHRIDHFTCESNYCEVGKGVRYLDCTNGQAGGNYGVADNLHRVDTSTVTLLTGTDTKQIKVTAADTTEKYLSAALSNAGNVQFTQIDTTGNITLKGDVDLSGKADLSGGKIPISQIPDSVVGQLEYQGAYDAATNTPALPVATSNKGHYYVTSVAGTQQSLDLDVGDWIVSNGTAYEKIDNTDAVASVFGRMGAVTAEAGDYNAGQITETATAKIFTDTERTKLTGIEDGANNYVHPTGDGNQHVPATGTTNDTKVLKAGSTAGSAAWGVVQQSEIPNLTTDIAARASLAGAAFTGNISAPQLQAGKIMLENSFGFSISDLQGVVDARPLLLGYWADMFQHRTIYSAEYFDGTAWVDWASNISEIQKLLDGNPITQITVPAANNHFRFVTDTPFSASTGLLQIYQEWVTGGTKDFQLTLERCNVSDFSGTITTILDKTITGGDYFFNESVSTHSTEKYYRITINVTTDVETKWNWIRLFSARIDRGTYRGLPFTWQYDKSVTFDVAPKVLTNAIWHAGTFNPADKSDIGHTHDDRYSLKPEQRTLTSLTGIQVPLGKMVDRIHQDIATANTEAISFDTNAAYEQAWDEVKISIKNNDVSNAIRTFPAGYVVSASIADAANGSYATGSLTIAAGKRMEVNIAIRGAEKWVRIADVGEVVV